MRDPGRLGERTVCRGCYDQLPARRKGSSSSVLSLAAGLLPPFSLPPLRGAIWMVYSHFAPGKDRERKRFAVPGSGRGCPTRVVSGTLSIQTPLVRPAIALSPWDRLPPAFSAKANPTRCCRVYPFSFTRLLRVNTGLSPCIPSPKPKVIWLGGLFCAFFQPLNASLHNLNVAHVIFHTVLIQNDV